MKPPLRFRAPFAASAIAVFAAVTTGCAAPRPMALSTDQATLDVGPQQSLVLAAVKVANVYKPGYQPHVKELRLRSLAGKGEELAFDVGRPFRASGDEGNQFEELLLTLALAPGDYELTGIQVSAGPVVMRGSGLVPVNARFQVPPGKTIYLGRIEAVRRERQGDEPRAGPVVPLIQQSVSGFYGGTFDVKLFDGYDHDLPLMRAEYPALRTVAVEKLLLSPTARAAP
jgi:hypothetical protein